MGSGGESMWCGWRYLWKKDEHIRACFPPGDGIRILPGGQEERQGKKPAREKLVESLMNDRALSG